ncbi:metallophosphoesterase [Sphingobacterium faecale]|uniref:Metallophosphoesterase n=1 Tax=Sphingobacterium faecale TaxID=2803775 RepID=A0ABS1R3R0_9SPHI|nr:metallophosphoesterase [Sphingobacterium faecale]MBL1409333.1 metallophosphoesterase [Sphingobacterium faecale]
MTKKIFLFLFLFLSIRSNAQSNFQKPHLENKSSWSVILLPDVQNYSKWNRNQPILDLMMAWIEDNIDTLNIKMVLCTGDLVEQNDLIMPANNGDQSAEKQWNFISKSFSRLNGKTPYIAAVGNHDFSIDSTLKRTTRYDDFFKIDDNWLNKKALVQNGTNESAQQSLQNAVYEVKSINGGKDYLFMTIEYAPRDTVLGWASKITRLEQYKNHRIVLLTHVYLSPEDKQWDGQNRWIIYQPYVIDNKTLKSERYLLPFSNNGKQIWEKLVKPADNIEMVLSGHILGEGYRMDKNHIGKPVHQMLFDMQGEGGGHIEGNGGDGWLRILEFFPDNKTVKVKTYSPLFGSSPSTRNLAWRKDGRNEYTMQFQEK